MEAMLNSINPLPSKMPITGYEKLTQHYGNYRNYAELLAAYQHLNIGTPATLHLLINSLAKNDILDFSLGEIIDANEGLKDFALHQLSHGFYQRYLQIQSQIAMIDVLIHNLKFAKK